MPKERKHFYGGQAVMEGVMMRGKDTWALAVRRPTSDIYIEQNVVKGLAGKYALFRKPLFRGVAALGEALSIGMRALTTSANQALEEDEKLTTKQMAVSMTLAFVLFIGIFIVLPALGVNFFGGKRIKRSITFNAVEGVVRVMIFVAYLVGISFIKEIRRVFMYHGAEHKTINAYEAGAPLTPESVKTFSLIHPRCGTTFLIVVVIISFVVFSLLG
ncbi:MAG: DUF1385 domain-containing protein, partial [Actinomycetota bacterium]